MRIMDKRKKDEAFKPRLFGGAALFNGSKGKTFNMLPESHSLRTVQTSYKSFAIEMESDFLVRFLSSSL